MTSSTAFDRLEPRIQRWIWQQGWTTLRDVQERAIATILDGRGDVVISAATAGGKTEAAFLPVVSAIATEDGTAPSGFEVLAVSPLKALINDQARRLEALCDMADVALHKWHGDVADTAKRKARRQPAGVLIITPESLEALFVLRGLELPRLFAELRFIVVDELHAFLVSERGIQLQSLLHRIELLTNRRVKRIGLSATLGDMQLAAAALRPSDPATVTILDSSSDEAELKLQVRGYQHSSARGLSRDEDADDAPQQLAAARQAIADHLLKVLRGCSNLVFAGSRQSVEIYADRLRQMCEDASIPNEFFPHHGSLAKELRHDVETRLREGRLPTTAVCTTTLELGIDIGDVESIAQLGAPRSIAALRQRLGRSGRRQGKPSILRIYIEEEPIDAQSSLLLRLRPETVLAVAGVRLLLAGWCEPPPQRAMHLSTLLHQVLSIIAAQGGAQAATLYQTLCATGPFCNVSRSLFSQLLRQMGDPEVELIEQAPDGMLLLGREGERVVEHYTFYAVFETPAEYRVVAEGKTLGTVPISFPVRRNDLIIFAGRRWEVIELHERQRVVEVKRARGGTPPAFGGEGVALHDQIVKEMRKVFTSTDLPTYLDAQGRSLLDEGREAFRMAELDRVSVVANGESTLLFPWVGTRRLVTLAMALTAEGLKTRPENMVIIADHSVNEVKAALAHLSHNAPPAPLNLARQAANKQQDKYDRYLDEELLALSFAGSALITDGLPELAAEMLTEIRGTN